MANLGLTSVPAQGQTQQATLETAKHILEARAKKGASWFYWIAGLSVVNSIIVLSGRNTHFVVGLGITEVFDVVGGKMGGAGNGVALGFSLAIAGVFALFGYFAHNLRLWSFIVGMVLYALDALFLLSFSDYLSVGFHAFALYCLYLGLVATRKWSALKPANAPLG